MQIYWRSFKAAGPIYRNKGDSHWSWGQSHTQREIPVPYKPHLRNKGHIQGKIDFFAESVDRGAQTVGSKE